MSAIDFWFSIGSTYTYLTVRRLPELAAREGVDVTWRPFDVRAIMLEQNNIPFRDKPVKTAYMWRDIARRAGKYRLAPQLPAPYPLNDLAFANQVALLGLNEGWGQKFVIAAYENWFEKGLVPDEGEGLTASLEAAGQDPEPTIARAASDTIAAQLVQDTETARDLGVFGSPSFAVGGEIFWGDDRLEDAIAWARHGSLA
ncbi:2-hydroxychromene-2-carboxylate isomerase [Marimonas arenosa]|uniref:2-hydroxychromene-2-carboxylate isomerase n=1 Tax=Marimonas arenosa TaxID=1795305 RepID=A0AAE4B785_9RHOB|nr:2-hydroxychromene-2-carboxylate isomerase [Marimonas arenosa]MDQ2091206.1 2-hydroxychromene-2-carboxylate isomerase [Marimonas arenosa]